MSRRQDICEYCRHKCLLHDGRVYYRGLSVWGVLYTGSTYPCWFYPCMFSPIMLAFFWDEGAALCNPHEGKGCDDVHLVWLLWMGFLRWWQGFGVCALGVQASWILPDSNSDGVCYEVANYACPMTSFILSTHWWCWWSLWYVVWVVLSSMNLVSASIMGSSCDSFEKCPGVL